MASIKSVIVLRNDTMANWEAYSDVVLLKGEIGIAFDTNGTKKIKIGDGVTEWKNLDWWNDLSADENTFVYDGKLIKLAGFDAAPVGAHAVKGADGKLVWEMPSEITPETLQAQIESVKGDVTNLTEIVAPSEGSTLTERIEALEGQLAGTGEGTVESMIDAKINEFATGLTDNGKVDTLMEMITYVEEHGEEAARLTKQITTLEELVGETPVAEQVATAVAKSEAKAEQLYVGKKYEIAHRPAKSRVNYMDEEIRLMCAADTEWTLQNSGENADANMYYFGFKAYAPAGAVSFKEDVAEKISDNTMYYFTGNEFAGIDVYGRKYSIVWLPAARYDAEADKWTYYGASSGNGKYIGWYYSVEWYDADGVVIDSDTVRINLTNEECHNAIEPFYMDKVVKGISVNGTLLDVIDHQVNISIDSVIKSNEEIIANEDGTLSIGKIGFDKISTEDVEIVIDGGGANVGA